MIPIDLFNSFSVAPATWREHAVQYSAALETGKKPLSIHRLCRHTSRGKRRAAAGTQPARSGTVVVFIASDGYRATAPLKTLLNGKGVLTTEIKGNKPSQKWESFKFGNRYITPAPFYLVWDGISYQNKAYPWPWGIVDIQFESANSLYPMALPNSENSAALSGFDTFSNHCLPCHSINGDGGNLGPEFNYPKSITEYWQESDFVAFAKNPKSYRISSAMYPKDFLTDPEFKSIWAYLKDMANRKVAPKTEK